jgi:hypothetical protein
MPDIPLAAEVPPEADPGEQALRECLQVCGFGHQDQNRIIIMEGIVSLDDLGLLTETEIDNMAKNPEGRLTAAERLRFGAMRLKKFKALAFWVWDRLRRSMTLDPTVFTDAVLLESIQNMDSEKEIKDTKARNDIPILIFTSGVDFPRWMDDFRNALGARVGASGVTLNYVIRPEATPETFIDNRERLIYETTHGGNFYCRDNAEVYKTLQAALDAEDKTSGWPYVKPFERAQDGRAAWLALVQHYGAGGEEKKLVELVAKATPF